MQDYIVKKARSLGHMVVGCSEFRSTLLCPLCYSKMDKLKECNERVCKCTKCGWIAHRDEKAGLCLVPQVMEILKGNDLPEPFRRIP